MSDFTVDYQTHPSQYRHWSLSVDGEIATLSLDIQEDGGILPLDPSVEPKITLAWIKYLYSTADKRNQAASSQRMLTYADVC